MHRSPRHAIVRYVQASDINELKMCVVGCESTMIRNIQTTTVPSMYLCNKTEHLGEKKTH